MAAPVSTQAPAPARAEAARLRAADGYQLAADVFTPAIAPRAAALVAPAMGVRRGFYAPLARYLAEAGILSLSLDYRGMGDSRPASLRGFPARLRDWGEQDLAAGVAELSRRAPGAPLLWVGHSVGGQLLGLLPEAPVRAAVFLGCQSGWAGHWSGLSRAVMTALWWGFIPASTALAGYLPMRALGQGDDVPAGVAREWASWGRHRRYIGRYADAAGGLAFARYAGAIRSYAFSDDAYAPPAACRGLLSLYRRARSELKLVRPEDLGARSLGHFAPLRERFREPLWRDVRDWLLGEAERA
jgi:predicted alpha/beta hydrolase